MAGHPYKYRHLDKIIGKRLRVTRWDRGMSQDELGIAVGLSWQGINGLETGANRIAATYIYLAAKALRVSPDYLFMDLDAPETDALDKLNPDSMELLQEFHALSLSHQQAIREVIRQLPKRKKKDQ